MRIDSSPIKMMDEFFAYLHSSFFSFLLNIMGFSTSFFLSVACFFLLLLILLALSFLRTYLVSFNRGNTIHDYSYILIQFSGPLERFYN